MINMVLGVAIGAGISIIAVVVTGIIYNISHNKKWTAKPGE